MVFNSLDLFGKKQRTTLGCFWWWGGGGVTFLYKNKYIILLTIAMTDVTCITVSDNSTDGMLCSLIHTKEEFTQGFLRGCGLVAHQVQNYERL